MSNSVHHADRIACAAVLRPLLTSHPFIDRVRFTLNPFGLRAHMAERQRLGRHARALAYLEEHRHLGVTGRWFNRNLFLIWTDGFVRYHQAAGPNVFGCSASFSCVRELRRTMEETENLCAVHPSVEDRNGNFIDANSLKDVPAADLPLLCLDATASILLQAKSDWQMRMSEIFGINPPEVYVSLTRFETPWDLHCDFPESLTEMLLAAARKNYADARLIVSTAGDESKFVRLVGDGPRSTLCAYAKTADVNSNGGLFRMEVRFPNKKSVRRVLSRSLKMDSLDSVKADLTLFIDHARLSMAELAQDATAEPRDLTALQWDAVFCGARKPEHVRWFLTGLVRDGIARQDRGSRYQSRLCDAGVIRKVRFRPYRWTLCPGLDDAVAKRLPAT